MSEESLLPDPPEDLEAPDAETPEAGVEIAPVEPTQPEEPEAPQVSKEEFDSLKQIVLELQLKQRRDDEADAIEQQMKNSAQELRIAELEQQIATMQQPEPQTEQLQGADLSFPVWIGQDDSGTIRERACDGGTFDFMENGREVDSADVFELDTDQAMYLDVIDYNGGAPKSQRVKVSGGGSVATRFKVTTATNVTNGVTVAKRCNQAGTITDTIGVSIRSGVPADINAFIYAMPVNVTNVTDVTWIEVDVGETEANASEIIIGTSLEGDEAADSVVGSLADDTVPFNFWAHTRQAYFHAGDKKWYAYARLLKVNSRGKVYYIGAENRIEIDAPEDCGGGTTPAAFFSY